MNLHVAAVRCDLSTLRVIPGHRAAMNPEPMHTDFLKVDSNAAADFLDKTVFMGSGFGLAGRPGMTTVIREV